LDYQPGYPKQIKSSSDNSIPRVLIMHEDKTTIIINADKAYYSRLSCSVKNERVLSKLISSDIVVELQTELKRIDKEESDGKE